MPSIVTNHLVDRLLDKPSGLARCALYARASTKRFLYNHPILFTPVAKALRPHWLSDHTYDIMIDGFPRSANTFAAAGLRLCDANLRVVCHHHNPISVIRALNHGKPTCVLVRDPVDALASFMIQTGWRFDYAIAGYVMYYRTLAPFVENILVATFQQVTNDFPLFVARINSAFGWKIRPPTFTNAFKQQAFDAIAEGPWGRDPLKISIPQKERDLVSGELRSRLSSPLFNDILREARALYTLFRERTLPPVLPIQLKSRRAHGDTVIAG